MSLIQFNTAGHHEHDQFKLEQKDKIFWCSICKEIGNGTRYTCSSSSDRCNHHIHQHCMKPPFFLEHPFFRGHCRFTFLRTRVKGRRCDACGGEIKGSMYHLHHPLLINKLGWDLHPCCAKLPPGLGRDPLNSELVLRPKSSSECVRCGKKSLDKELDGWSYESTRDHGGWYNPSLYYECKKVHLHVGCAREILKEVFLKLADDDDDPVPGRTDKGSGGGARGPAVVVLHGMPTLEMEQVPAAVQISRKYLDLQWRKYNELQSLLRMAKSAVRLIFSAIAGDPTFKSDDQATYASIINSSVIDRIGVKWKCSNSNSSSCPKKKRSKSRASSCSKLGCPVYGDHHVSVSFHHSPAGYVLFECAGCNLNYKY